MAGGLLNLVGVGNQNVILNGNPQKTFWTSTYKRYTNFGLQNFRLDYEGLRQLSPSSDTTLTFKVKRYAELLTETYFVIQLPDIYSPIYPPSCSPDSSWAPYEFKWVKNLGAAMIRSIRFTIGGSLIQTMTGLDMIALANRDLNGVQKRKWDCMVGNTVEMHDPANAFNRLKTYPNTVYDPLGAEPSIRGRQLRVPIPIWWAMNSQQAFPLVCLQYNELQIEVVLRPLRELFQIRDVTDPANNFPVVAPNFNLSAHQFHRFIQPPPNPQLEYASLTTSWNENAHLSCTYCFLSDEESKVFALNEHDYLIKEVHHSWFYKVAVTDKAWLQNSTGMVASWMILFQRSDANLRNEWSNFTNWPYDFLPFDITPLPILMEDSPCSTQYDFDGFVVEAGTLGYGLNPSGRETALYSTGTPSPENRKEILVRMGITFDGSVREEIRGVEMYKYEQQYATSPGFGSCALPGLNCYNFCLDTSPFDLQPSGAVNLSKYSKIELDFTTIEPTLDPNSNFRIICDPETGGVVGTVKPAYQLYDYTFNLLVIEERFNVLKFMGGNAALMNAR
jgi:hypothetical protein